MLISAENAARVKYLTIWFGSIRRRGAAAVVCLSFPCRIRIFRRSELFPHTAPLVIPTFLRRQAKLTHLAHPPSSFTRSARWGRQTRGSATGTRNKTHFSNITHYYMSACVSFFYWVLNINTKNYIFLYSNEILTFY